eukprot:Blabericola_migrator_1__10150@NODE_565_length_7563_cov_135_385406_g422_i0_p1_GENE_NODE_565_length_7563_cov_135_385406_g422_i0NODE_565_length_7563_cov_135_385406_g422_i0_p1_ORF_typecomplete_len659_score112_59PX/PF00787_24/5_6e15ANAPC4_WD40/PF12894_7/7_3e03ANAPC4_WD40/PF12894_7/1_3e02ANAPC4_WD40/PF12894_7/1_6e05ANAPC4_WD40/PF12894_7/0_25WD40/PF00400_32/3e03WD40/PF00400_32/2_8e02WD40/PF00400_32/38WD40/PF00400_32/0_066Frtz/PF11768_8/63Frtz/PF11768_8/0_84WD40_like/PF17005_5/2_6e03WD40_like/PF17005_5/
MASHYRPGWSVSILTEVFQVKVQSGDFPYEQVFRNAPGFNGGSPSSETGQESKFAVYRIRCTIPLLQQDWIVNKRFSDFVTLRNTLAGIFVSMPDLPPKTFGRILTPGHLESRRIALDAFLKIICARRDIVVYPDFHTFLGIDEMVPDLASEAFCREFKIGRLLPGQKQFLKAVSEPRLIATMRDPNFGIKDAQFLEDRNLLLTICNDFSFASKVDALMSAALSAIIPTDTLIPLSRFCIWKVTPRTTVEEAALTPCSTPHLTAADDRRDSIVEEGAFSFELVYVQYYSRRMSALAFYSAEDMIFLGFETGDMLAYSLGRMEVEPRLRDIKAHRDSAASSMEESLITAFHDEIDGRHLNKIRSLDGHVSTYDMSSPEERHLNKQVVERLDLPLLPQIGCKVTSLGVVQAEGKPLLFVGGSGSVCSFYDLELSKLWGGPYPLPSAPYCMAQHPAEPIIAVGMADGSVAVCELRNQDVVTLGVETPPGGSTQRLEYIHFLDLKAHTAKIHSITGVPPIIPNGEVLLLAGGRDNGVTCWTVNTHDDHHSIKVVSRIAKATVDIPTCGICDLSSLSIVIGTKSGIVSAVCLLTGEPLSGFRSHVPHATSNSQLGGHSEGISSLQWIERIDTQRILITAGRDGFVHFWAWPMVPAEAYVAVTS